LQATPFRDRLFLDDGSWTVYAWLQCYDAAGGSGDSDACGPPLPSQQEVVVTGPGGSVTVSAPDGKRTIERNGNHYAAFAEFEAGFSGRYLITVEGSPGTRFIIAPTFEWTDEEAALWIVLTLLAGTAFVGGAVLLGVGLSRASGTRRAVAAGGPVAASGYAAAAAPVQWQLPVPGWYPDPQFPYRLRYWSGTSWTEHTS